MPKFLPLLVLTMAMLSCGESHERDARYGGSFFMPPPDTQILVLYDLVDPPTLDPAQSWGLFDGQLIGLIFSNLVRFDQQNHLYPDIARSWEISPDGLVFTFDLKPEAQFSNGRAITSEDVRYSIQRSKNEKNPLLSQIAFASIDCPSPQRIVFRLQQPYVPFLSLLATAAGAIVPREAVEECERLGIPFGERPLGSGPWLLKEWKHDSYLSLLRSETYWGPKPSMPALTYRIINNPFTSIAEFEVGNIAIIAPLPEAEILRWTTHPQWKKYSRFVQRLNTDMLIFNCQKPPLDRQEIRQALSGILNTELMLEAIREGAGTPSAGPIPPGITGHTPRQKPRAYDSASAKDTLARYGVDKQPLILLLPSVEGFIRTTGEVAQALWKEAGLNIQIQQAEWVTYRRMLRQGEYDIAFRAWEADFPDGDSFLYPQFHSSQVGISNLCRLSSPELDSLIETSQREADPQRRAEWLQKADDLTYDLTPGVFLWHRGLYMVQQPWLSNYRYPLIYNGTKYLEETITPTKD